MAWDLVGELRQLSSDLISVSPQANAIKAKHPAILDSAAKQIERSCEDRFLTRKMHSEIISKVDEAQKKAIGEHEEALQDGHGCRSDYCSGVLRGMRIIREILAPLEMSSDGAEKTRR